MADRAGRQRDATLGQLIGSSALDGPAASVTPGFSPLGMSQRSASSGAAFDLASPPAISVPKGGGAIRGIGEKKLARMRDRVVVK